MNAGIYTRISEGDQSAFSLDAQLAAARDYAERQGWTVVAVYVERKTAKDADRPEFQRMIAAAKAGQFQVIIVHKLDRFARNREDAVTYKALLRRVGVQVVSVTEQLGDDPMSRLVEGILEVVADWFLHNLRQETGKGMKRMAERGLWPTLPPLGYVRHPDPNNKTLVREEPHAEHISTAFHEFATGKWTLEQWAKEAYRLGMRERSGKRIAPSRWSRMFNHRIYLGLIPWCGEKYPGQHQALTDRKTFDQVQAILTEHNGARGRHRASGDQRRQYLLAGLLWSNDADCRMKGASATGRKATYTYYISNQPLTDGSRHRVPCGALEGQIPAILANVTIDSGYLPGLNLPKQVRFGLRVAANVGAVYSQLDDPAVKRQLVLTVFDRLGVSGEEIQTVKVRPPFSTNGASHDGLRFDCLEYPWQESNLRPKV